MKFGRNRPTVRAKLALRNYLTPAFPVAPEVIHYSRLAEPFLFKVLGNDRLGDCTAAAAFHAGGVFLGNAGAPIPYDEAEAITFYSATSGYVPGDPATDNGADEITVLNYWKATGLLSGAHRIAGYTSVDATNEQQVRAALWLFENVYFGVELPQAWVDAMPAMKNGFIWDVAGAPDPNAGHAFVGVGYNDVGVQIDTWGMIGTITWAAVAKYASTAGQGELYAVLGPDAIAKATGKTPAGFDAEQLVADLAALG
jgi:hypothetical protein